MSHLLDRLIAELAAHSPRQVADVSRREAAVALILTGDPDRLLLIRRAEREGDPWSGHLALPGGRRDAADGDLLDTAIRETFEETGLVLVRGDCRAVLDDLAPVTPILPPITVRPYLFQIPESLAPGVSDEVAHAGWVSLEELTRTGVYRLQEIEVHGTKRSVAGYQLHEGFLWGMTERMVTPVLTRWRGLQEGS